jgi:glycosyltransferase involved in cell wall biosynthesis
VLDSPNGHIRNFRRVYEREAEHWLSRRYIGHPSPAMVERVEEEYRRAERIRVSSEWAKASLVAGGVPASKVQVLRQPVDLTRFRPPALRPPQEGPLRLCFVGSLDLRKGFVYLLRAMKQLGAGHAELQMVGATGSRGCRLLLETERKDLQVSVAAGDPVGALHRAEVFVLPTLEDGWGFAATEAMACGLPIVVTDQCGAAEWVRNGETGWVVPAGNVDALAGAIEQALRKRPELFAMGDLARADTEQRANADSCGAALRNWLGAPFVS